MRKSRGSADEVHKLRSGSCTDVGQTRSENQDFLGAVKDDDGWSLFLVCDGMGGHAGGSTASTLAVEKGLAAFEANSSGDLNPKQRIDDTIQKANEAVYLKSKRVRALRGMGTTCVALLFNPEHSRAWFAHVGDSRIYMARRDLFRQLTRDHTMVQRMVDDGILTPEQAAVHPHSNVISRSLGGSRAVEVEHCEEVIHLETGDMFMQCSDGLTGHVSDLEIAETMWRFSTPAAASEALVDFANERGGEDNITVQVVCIGARGKAPKDIETLKPPRRPTTRMNEDGDWAPPPLHPDDLEDTEADEDTDAPGPLPDDHDDDVDLDDGDTEDDGDTADDGDTEDDGDTADDGDTEDEELEPHELGEDLLDEVSIASREARAPERAKATAEAEAKASAAAPHKRSALSEILERKDAETEGRGLLGPLMIGLAIGIAAFLAVYFATGG